MKRFLSALVLLLAGCGDDVTRVSSATDVASPVAATPLAAKQDARDPAYRYSESDLSAALSCDKFTHPDRDPVLLVHGTFTHGRQNWGATFAPILRASGWDVCIVTYPDRGLVDIQRTTEFVAHAVYTMAAASGRKVALIGHSQGVMQVRWAVKWWPGVRERVSDLVSLAGPNQGILLPTAPRDLLGVLGVTTAPFPGTFYQFAQNSQFLRALNRDDETQGDIDYTVLYTQFDELIQPVSPFPAGAIEFGQTNPKRTNVLLQDVCPGRLVDHISIALADRLAYELTLDALRHDGPANVQRAGGSGLCNLVSLLPELQFPADAFSLLLTEVLLSELEQPLPDFGISFGEPPLMPYAQ